MHPGVEKGYALDFLSVIRHVATEMDGAAPAALSIEEMAATYQAGSGDLARVRDHHDVPSDIAAKEFLVERALDELSRYVASDNGGFKLAVDFDKIRYERKKIVKYEEDLPPLGGDGKTRWQKADPFDPNTGEFSENIRSVGNMDDLRESMKEFGWIEELPAIQDERGVIIMGNRRIAVAKELDITPVVKTVKFGQGDEADARRFKLAIASNIGFKAMTKQEKERIAQYLYGEREWVQEKIAEALNVSQKTVAGYTKGIPGPARKPKNPGGRGNVLATPEHVAEIMRRHDNGESAESIAKDMPFGKSAVKERIREEKIRREAAQAPAQPEPDPPAEPEPSAEPPEPQADPDPTHPCPKCGFIHPIHS